MWGLPHCCGAPTHVGHAVEGTLADSLHEACALQLADEVEGVATANGYAVGVVDGVDGQRFVVYRGELYAEFFVYGSHLGLVGVIALGQSVGSQRHTSVWDEEHFLDIVPLAKVGNHILAPAEVSLAAHSAVAYQK